MNTVLLIVSFMKNLDEAENWLNEVEQEINTNIRYRTAIVVIDGEEQDMTTTSNTVTTSKITAGNIYSSYGFGRSITGVWNTQSLNYYSNAQAHGRILPSSKGQDVHQMAGDIIINQYGKIIYTYYSASNTDRPSVDALFDVVKQQYTLDNNSSTSSTVVETNISSSLTTESYHISIPNDNSTSTLSTPSSSSSSSTSTTPIILYRNPLNQFIHKLPSYVFSLIGGSLSIYTLYRIIYYIYSIYYMKKLSKNKRFINRK